MSLDATVGGVSANSYITRAAADAYHAARLQNAAWTAALDASKDAALQWATRILDRQPWCGSNKANLTQALRWPRYGVYDLDAMYVASDIIPAFLVEATAELAFLLVQADRTADAGTEGFSKIKVGEIELEINSLDRRKALTPAIAEIIGPYVERGMRMERG